ncbi:hypothetical protein [Viridibacterium curvum]|uniref:Lipoprotein n=1 Tax=Viridibacterium curvum TaxID=1101404 RepID=A0ABP9QMK9_9RHOO
MIIRIVMLLSAALLLSGCMVGQQLSVNYVPAASQLPANGVVVTVAVSDKRDFVLKGEKDAAYVGSYTAGLGNRWSVMNLDNVPLAAQIAKDLKQELVSLGYAEATAGQKELRVTIQEWVFAGYQNAEFEYALLVEVLDKGGKKLFETTLKGRKDVPGTIMSGMKGGMERDMPGIYNAIIRSIARDNTAVLAALKS